MRHVISTSRYEAELLASGAVPLALGAITRPGASPALRSVGAAMLGALAHEHTAHKMATERKHAAAVDAARERDADRQQTGQLLARELEAQLAVGAVAVDAADETARRTSSRGSREGNAGRSATETDEAGAPPRGKIGDGMWHYSNVPKPCAASSLFFAAKELELRPHPSRAAFLAALPAMALGTRCNSTTAGGIARPSDSCHPGRSDLPCAAPPLSNRAGAPGGAPSSDVMKAGVVVM